MNKIVAAHSRSPLACVILLWIAINISIAAPKEKTLTIPVTDAMETRASTGCSSGDSFNEVMLNSMNKIGCSAASLAIARKGELVISRGYGWIDEKRKMAVKPHSLIGIASCDKPITAAAIKQLARSGKFSLDDAVYKLLKIRPRGKIIDDRIRKITIRHLLEHKAGWQGEPVENAVKSARLNGNKDPIPTRTLLSLVAVQNLKDEPGTKYEYCNFCYDTLRYVIQVISGQSPAEYFRHELFRPFGIDEMKGFQDSQTITKRSDPLIVWNAKAGGPICASAPALCGFMRHYWLTGEQRDDSNPTWRMDGSLPGSTAMMMWRSDGVDIAFVFNGRAKISHSDILKEIEDAIEKSDIR